MHLSPAVWSAFSWREYARWCGQYASRRVDDGRAINSVVKLVSSFCRVEGGLPCYRHDVCVLRLPPGFPAVPQYLRHTLVVPQSLTEPDKWLSHIRLFVQPFSGAKGFRFTRTRTWGQPTCRRTWRNPSQVYDLRWLRRFSHLNSARRVRCIYR